MSGCQGGTPYADTATKEISDQNCKIRGPIKNQGESKLTLALFSLSTKIYQEKMSGRGGGKTEHEAGTKKRISSKCENNQPTNSQGALQADGNDVVDHLTLEPVLGLLSGIICQDREQDPNEEQAWQQHVNGREPQKNATRRIVGTQDKQRKNQKTRTSFRDRLALLTSGWTINQTTKNTDYITPKLKIRFRSLASSRVFESLRLPYPADETRAVEKYIQNVGRQKFQSVARNMGK